MKNHHFKRFFHGFVSVFFWIYGWFGQSAFRDTALGGRWFNLVHDVFIGKNLLTQLFGFEQFLDALVNLLGSVLVMHGS